MSSRWVIPALVTAALLVPVANAGSESEQSRKPVPNRAPLAPNTFNPLPLGAITPRGWLRTQLEIQAAGLTGHLGDFWKDVGNNSGWLGGTGESWERGPYYLDGLLPLAYELGDAKLIEKAKQWVEWTLTHQQANGQIGPTANDDWWPRMVMLKVLTQYQEVTGDPRVVPLMTKYFHYELSELPKRPLRDWGKYRWQDNVYSVLWLYNRTGDSQLLELARLLHEQGYDWRAQFTKFSYTQKTNREMLGLRPHSPIPDRAMQTHGVNNAMALKASPLWYLVTHDPEERAALDRQLAELNTYHGLPNGMFSGDEHFAGPDPSQGIELCAVVESMFSLEQAFAILGDPLLADRLEKITYNALPATLSNDLWSHQYDQQPNQISCTRAPRQWSTNGDESNLFGLEPNFGCCTANLHQGWPKFVSALWMGTGDGGLVTTAYAPSQVKTVAGNTSVTIDEETDYPFRDTVRLSIHPSRSTAFPIVLRIPSWAGSTSVVVNGKQTEVPSAGCTLPDGQSKSLSKCDPARAFHRIFRTWKDGDTLDVHFVAQPRVTHWYHNSATFENGPLVFALPLEAELSELKHYAEKSADWQLTPTKQEWNFAMAATTAGACKPELKNAPEGPVPFDVRHPRVELEVYGRRLPGWTVNQNSAGPLPVSPVKVDTAVQRLTLIPYGAAKLRITAFPYLAGPTPCK